MTVDKSLIYSTDTLLLHIYFGHKNETISLRFMRILTSSIIIVILEFMFYKPESSSEDSFPGEVLQLNKENSKVQILSVFSTVHIFNRY